MSATVLAVDWGTTNRRVFALAADGTVIATERDGRGLLAVPPGGFAAEAAAIRARFGELPMLCAGMVGSARGWVMAPYLACPAGLAELAAGLVWAEPGRTAIVPGLSCLAADGRGGDVMRGEEVQVLGAVAAGLAPPDALLCQPGTHCKWAQVRGGAIAGFATAMTGELFALLRQHSLLADFLAGPVTDGAAFREGVRASLADGEADQMRLADGGADQMRLADGAAGNGAFAGGLLARLFGVRAAALLGLRADADHAAYASGLLIGADVAARRLAPGASVHVLADAHLGALYAAAIAEAGARPVLIDSHDAFVAGVTRIRSLAHDHFAI